MPDLAVPNQDDGRVSRLVLEEQGCSSHLPSVPSLVAVQEKLPEKVTDPNNFEIPSQLEGDVVNNQDAGRKNGEIVIRPSKEVVEQGSKKWQATAVGYFLGKRPYFPHLESFVRSNWKGPQTVSATSSGFYFFHFQTRMAMEVVIEGGPWLFQGQPIVLQFWEQGMSLRRQKHTKIPVWIRMKHLPMEYWTDEGLSTVASGIGTPLYTDGITKDCSRLDFARAELRDELKTGVANPEFILVPKTKSVPSTRLACSDKIEDGQASTANPKGKEIVIFNSYGVLDLDSTNDTAVDLDVVNLLPGPNICSPSLEAP
ncbi:UNVERIFIED_CONTAM: hypothetical protein Sradi_0927000 [Sesamum radiatum]|uniref:DUF4283 domain-containing protein n=1 Tax=Sesamum radiatum TaxID=300843 RepID=A0AAW2V429_SESRA